VNYPSLTQGALWFIKNIFTDITAEAENPFQNGASHQQVKVSSKTIRDK